jgi:2,4-didehydro-3-deoxy-L-rhamnonate hydrolase
MAFRFASIDKRSSLVADNGGWYDLARISGGAVSADPMAALAEEAALHDWYVRLGSFEADGQMADATHLIGPPVPRPQKSIAIGLNYANHAAESSNDVPENPLAFTKFPSCIVGPHADVALRSAHSDYEAELVVVIGRGGRDIAKQDAWSHVLGLTAGQDISDRALQFAAKPPHFDLGKSRDTYGPMGPVLVSPDMVADRNDIAIRCLVNGEVRQNGSTKDLIFNIEHLIAYLSSIMTLTTGDVIFTGTPEGIGATRGLFLKPGDEIVTEIDGIGTLRNRCVA